MVHGIRVKIVLVLGVKFEILSNFTFYYVFIFGKINSHDTSSLYRVNVLH